MLSFIIIEEDLLEEDLLLYIFYVFMVEKSEYTDKVLLPMRDYQHVGRFLNFLYLILYILHQNFGWYDIFL